ncbi:MAG: hypothetical protein NC319_04600 [Butyricicoccus sp.]|nr:hypothetical protein [Butyricicoccus sp.]
MHLHCIFKAKPHYFKCNGYVRGRCRSSQHIGVEKLHEAFMDKLRHDTAGSAPLRFRLAAPDTDRGIERARSALDSLERRLARAHEAYAAGVDTLEEYRRFRSGLEAEREAILAQIARLEAAPDPAQPPENAVRTALETLERPDASTQRKNSAARAVVQSCVFDKSSLCLKIVYRVFI